VKDQDHLEENNSLLSRREWLGKMALPAGAAITASLVGAEKLSAAPAKTASVVNDLGARIYNIRSFGAKGDKTTLDTAALQSAVDACANDGGGTVLVPAGTFTIGTVELKSNVTLHIAAGGKLLGSGDGKQYHAVDAVPLTGDSTLNDGNWSLLFAVNATNITIEGPGTIDGNGAQFISPSRGVPPPSGLGGLKRPYHILLYHCEHSTIRDISLVDCAYHSLRLVQSKYLNVDNIYIHNRLVGNGDGFHFISCEHVTISNSNIFSGDDACAMFGSCRFFNITNSTFSTRWSVFRFGGGQARNIAVSNCILRQVYGCPIKFQGNPGAGFENISFSNLLLDDVTGPIHISIGPMEPGRPTNPGLTPDQPGVVLTTPFARNISFSNIHGTVTTNPGPVEHMPSTNNMKYQDGERFNCITLNAVGDAVMENISFNNINLTFGGGGTAEIAARRNLPALASEYFRLGAMPAYGFYARNAHGVTLQNVRFQVSTTELRPAVIFDHVEDAALNGVSVQGNADAESVFRFINSSQVLVTAARVLSPSATFLQLEGESSSGIIIDGGDLSKASSAVALKNGATERSIKLRGI
jgi:polygalacturonase